MSGVTPHRVFWGSHGCDKNWPHTGACRCSCGSYLQDGYNVYGEDVEQAKTWQQRAKEKSV